MAAPSAADLAALVGLPGACRCGHAPEAHGSDGCRWHHISQGEPCGCVHFIEARSMPSLALAHAVVSAIDGDTQALVTELYAAGGGILAGHAAALARNYAAIKEGQGASETHVDASDPSATIDASRTPPRIIVHANGRALDLSVSEAHQLREQLDAALEPTRYPHGRGCQCSVCE
jgi:hypothetical protein